jgi:hypothetical protein
MSTFELFVFRSVIKQQINDLKPVEEITIRRVVEEYVKVNVMGGVRYTLFCGGYRT